VRIRPVLAGILATSTVVLAGAAQSPRRAPEESVLAPCFVPTGIDTSGWKVVHSMRNPFTILLPSTFRRDSTVQFRHGGVKWVDGRRTFEQGGGYWGSPFGEAGPGNLGYSECEDTLAGIRYNLITGYWANFSAYAVVGVPVERDPRSVGFTEALIFKSPDSLDQRLFLAILRTARRDTAVDSTHGSIPSRTKNTLGISLPCSLARSGSHLDGGSVGGLLIGAAGESLLFSWDGAMRGPHGPPPAWVGSDGKRAKLWFDSWMDSVDMIKPRLGFIRADYPGNPGAVALSVGSPAESLFIDALRSSVARDSDAAISEARRRELGNVSRVIGALESQRTKIAAWRARQSPEPKELTK